jgi:hypothetical protein
MTKRQDIYFQLVSETAWIGTKDASDPRREEAISLFWWIYWGPLPMVADKEVAEAADIFSEILHYDYVMPPDETDKHKLLRNASMNLARAWAPLSQGGNRIVPSQCAPARSSTVGACVTYRGHRSHHLSPGSRSVSGAGLSSGRHLAFPASFMTRAISLNHGAHSRRLVLVTRSAPTFKRR